MEIKRACVYNIEFFKIQGILPLIYVVASYLNRATAYRFYSGVPALLLGKGKTVFINQRFSAAGCTKIKEIVISFISTVCA